MSRALLVALCFVGCTAATGANASNTERDHRDGMLGFEDPLRIEDYWKTWTPIATYQIPDPISKSQAFDYWVVDSTVREQQWAALFSILDYFRTDSRVDHAQRRTIETLMAALEHDDAEMDATFLTTTSWEGVITRYANLNGDSLSSLSMLMQRRADAPQLSRVRLWLQPGYVEAPMVTILLERSSSGWRSATSIGLVADAEPNDEDVSTLGKLFESTFWSHYTGVNYVEYQIESSRPNALEPALGFRVTDRDFDRVFSDTAFPPKFNAEVLRPDTL